MTQIEAYQKPYNVVYGTWDEEANLVPGEGGTEWPIYTARRMVVALLASQISKLDENDPEIDELQKIQRAFQNASTGEVVWGMVKSWKNKKGVKRFIGLVRGGASYKEAGKSPNTFVPSRYPTKSIESNHHLRFGVDHKTSEPVKTRRPEPVMSEAERIADKMAKASRKAVEDSP